IDRGEADIGDVVYGLQRLHDEATDLVGHHLGLARAFELAGDATRRALDAVGIDIALADRDLHRAQQLVAVERHLAAGALDDDEVAKLHPLEGGEATAAIGADAAAADRRPVLGGARILDLRVFGLTERTAHLYPLRRMDLRRMLSLSAEIGVEREAAAERGDPVAYGGLDRGVALIRIRHLQPVEHLCDQLADLGELFLAEAA